MEVLAWLGGAAFFLSAMLWTFYNLRREAKIHQEMLESIRAPAEARRAEREWRDPAHDGPTRPVR